MSLKKSKKSSSQHNRKSVKDDDEEFVKECEAIYLSVFSALEEEITSSDELVLLLQYAGCNPSKKTLEKYWGPSIDSYDYNQFCSILKQEEKTSKKDLVKAFRKIDQNGDGFITHDELFQILTKRGERMTKSEVKMMIEDADFNGDGKLDYEEFCDMMDSTSKQCKQLYYSKNDSKIGSGRDRTASSSKEKQHHLSSVREEKRSSVLHTERNADQKRSLERKGTGDRKPSIMSKLANKDNVQNDSNEKTKTHLQKLKSEPQELSKWHFHMTKGSFYKEEDGKVESHQFQMKITQPTTIWITMKVVAPKYGKFSDDILETDATVFLVETNGGKLVAFTNSIIDGKNCLQAEVNIGVYDMLTFSSGAKLYTEASSSGQVILVKGTGDDAKLTKSCKDTLMEIFYRCDLDGNGYLSREEFNEFQMRSSGEGCDDEAWDVVKESIEVTPQFEMTPNGFIELNTMEVRDPDGGQDELWVTLDSMGYSKKLLLSKACPFQIEIFTRRGKNAVSLHGVSDGGEPLRRALNESIKMTSSTKAIKNKRDLFLHVSEFDNRITLAVENQAHNLVGVRLDCTTSENLVSDQGALDNVEDIEPKSMKVLHHLVPDRKSEKTKLHYQESIIR